MTQIHDEIRALRELLERHLETCNADAKTSSLPPPELVDAKYVAQCFGCSVSSVQAGACGTGEIPRFLNRPLKFRRADVEKALRQRAGKKTPHQRGLDLLASKGKRGR